MQSIKSPGQTGKKRTTVAKALIFFFVITTMALISGIAFSNYVQITKVIEKDHQEFSQHAVNEVRQSISTFVKYRLRILKDYAGFPILDQGVMQPGASREDLADFFDTLTILGTRNHLTLLDYKGSPIYSTRNTALEDSIKKDMVNNLITNSRTDYWSICLKKKEYYWVFAVPVFYNGMAEGIFVGEIPIMDFETDQNISTLLGKDRLDLIFDSRIVFSAGPRIETRPDEYPLKNSKLAIRFYWDYDRTGWMDKIGLVYQTSVIVMVLSIASFMVLFFLIKQYISTPLKVFNMATQTLTKDYAGSRITRDHFLEELAEGADGFNLMADQIYSRDKELRNLKDGLEIEIKLRTNEIQHERHNLETIFNAAPTGMILLDKDHKVTKTNQMITEQFKIRTRDMIGRYIGRALLCNSAEKHGKCSKEKDCVGCSVNQTIKKVLETGSEVRGKEFIHNSVINNEKISNIYLIRGTRLHMKGTDQVLLAFTNISILKEAEVAMEKARDEAESANRAKSEFLANMSHEIRTPLNAVLGFSDLLSSLVTNAKQKNYLESIHTAGKSLLTIINDILDLSKIEAGLLSMEFDFINIQTVIYDVMLIFNQACEEKGIYTIIDIDSDLPPGVLLDEIRLRQILLNLVGNAVKFTQKGHIKIKVIALKKEIDTCDLVISVEDTGMGISRDQQEIIFEAFQQQDGQSTRQFGGTGLGLTITRRLVELMNGQITLKSWIDKGSAFTITFLNLKVSNKETLAAKKREILDITTISFVPGLVLVVDDIESNRSLINETLTITGLDVMEAENGHEALSKVKARMPDLILMDIRMPVMDGYETAKKLKLSKKTRHIPIIATTASVPEKDNTFDFSDFDGFLSKPIKKEKLIQEISQFITCSINKKSGHLPVAGVEQIGKIKDLQGLLNRLDKKFIPIMESFTGALEMEDIKSIALELNSLGREHNSSFILKYADLLDIAVDNFDIMKIQELIDKFPSIIISLQGKSNANL